MRSKIDKIEIKEPPLEELTRKRSCLRRSCFTGLGCVTIIIVISLILLKFTLGPQTREIKDLPDNFTDTVPLYNEKGIEKIEITIGQERNKGAEYAAFLPKLFISPVLVAIDKDNSFIPELEDEDSDAGTLKTAWKKLIAFMKAPVADHRDVYKIEWTLLSSKADFIEEYYMSELEKKGFDIGLVSKTDTVSQFTFSLDTIDGLVYIRDKKDTVETDLVAVTVTVDLEKNQEEK